VGKTNVVANLALNLSEMGKKVVVLDADFGLANIDFFSASRRDFIWATSCSATRRSPRS